MSYTVVYFYTVPLRQGCAEQYIYQEGDENMLGGLAPESVQSCLLAVKYTFCSISCLLFEKSREAEREEK